jgi:hypothetical protein
MWKGKPVLLELPADNKKPYQSMTLGGPSAVDHKVIPRICAELLSPLSSVRQEFCKDMILKKKRTLPEFLAASKKPYRSMTLLTGPALGHKVIPRICVELLKSVQHKFGSHRADSATAYSCDNFSQCGLPGPTRAQKRVGQA